MRPLDVKYGCDLTLLLLLEAGHDSDGSKEGEESGLSVPEEEPLTFRFRELELGVTIAECGAGF